MADLEALRTAHHDAVVERAELERRRNERRVELEAEARQKVAAQIAAEFPEWETTRTAEADTKRALEDANIAAGHERLERMNYGRGVLVEWSTKDGNWYNLERRNWHYPTGRKGVVQVWDRQTKYPENMQRWSIPGYGDLFIRILKKDGNPGSKFYRMQNQEIPNWWLPEGEKHEKAAPE